MEGSIEEIQFQIINDSVFAVFPAMEEPERWAKLPGFLRVQNKEALRLITGTATVTVF